MSWENILKMPLFVGDDFKQPKNEEGDEFIWLQSFAENSTNVKFISKDGSVRATFKFGYLPNDAPVWKLYLFVVNEKLRGQGFGEAGLLELIQELRDDEQHILSKILHNYNKYNDAPYGHDKIEQDLMSAKPPLDIVLEHIDPESNSFWQGMVSKYSHLGLKK